VFNTSSIFSNNTAKYLKYFILLCDFLKKYKSPVSDQILTELIQAGGKILLSAIHKLINSVWNKDELPDQWKESITVPVHKKGDNTDCNNYCGISLLST
jgi:hypothetical protein